MGRPLFSFIRPLATIAHELRLLRELYELDLASREPPVCRVTESPSRDDTEVSYMGQHEPTKRERISARWSREADLTSGDDLGDDSEGDARGF